jgi:hypothetical protein
MTPGDLGMLAAHRATLPGTSGVSVHGLKGSGSGYAEGDPDVMARGPRDAIDAEFTPELAGLATGDEDTDDEDGMP